MPDPRPRRPISLVPLSWTYLLVVCSLQARQAPHYEFILPNGYVGWIQVIFSDPSAQPLPSKGSTLIVQMPETGVFRTSSLQDYFGTPNKFMYQSACEASRKCRTIPVPPDYVETSLIQGFGLGSTCGRGKGYSWFIFVIPPDVRKEIPDADWARYSDEYYKKRGTRKVMWDGTCPVPGRIKQTEPAH